MAFREMTLAEANAKYAQKALDEKRAKAIAQANARVAGKSAAELLAEVNARQRQRLAEQGLTPARPEPVPQPKVESVKARLKREAAERRAERAEVSQLKAQLGARGSNCFRPDRRDLCEHFGSYSQWRRVASIAAGICGTCHKAPAREHLTQCQSCSDKQVAANARSMKCKTGK